MSSESVHESDQAVMRRVQAGESAAFGELIRRYQRPLLRVARSRLGQTDAAEDVVQETFLAAFKSRHTYNEQFGFRTWLWTILLNQCHRYGGRLARRPQVLSWSSQDSAQTAESTSQGDEEPAVLSKLLAEERSALLAAVLDRLPATQSDALRLRFFGELKFDEIAGVMRCTPGTAKNRVKAGLLRLAELLREQDSSSPGCRVERSGDPT